VLLTIARDPGLRLRDIAAACHITERTTQSIVTDLEQAGCLSREREGRRTRCTLHLDATLGCPEQPQLSLRHLLAIFTPPDSVSASHRGREAQPTAGTAPARRMQGGSQPEGTVAASGDRGG
jgi:hypothetical protein